MSGRTAYYTATSLDGFIATDDDSLEWLFRQEVPGDGGDPHFAYDTFIARIGAMAMGATTFRWILDHMARTGEAWSYEIPCWVFTHHPLPEVAGADIRPADDVAATHHAMCAAAGERDRWVVGGGDLAGQFADAGLLDDVIVTIASVTLGSGRPLLPRALDLRVERTGRSGPFVCVQYSVVGSVGDGGAID